MFYRFLFLLFFGIKLIANESSHSDIAERIIEEASGAITHVEKGKIFLDIARVYLIDHKICLLNDFQEIIALPSIFSSNNGLYVETNALSIFGMWQCQVRGCKRWNSRFVNTCQNCHTPRGQS